MKLMIWSHKIFPYFYQVHSNVVHFYIVNAETGVPSPFAQDKHPTLFGREKKAWQFLSTTQYTLC